MKQTVTAIIIDDEIQAISALKEELFLHFKSIKVVGTAQDIPTGIQILKALKPQIVFLDIQLKDGLGFDILNAVKDSLSYIIFTTAYSHYALKAIKYAALDYLLKPIDYLDIAQALEKYTTTIYKENQRREQLEALNTNLEQQNPSKLAIKTGVGFSVIDVFDIQYCQASGNYTYIFTANGEKFIVSKTLKVLENNLSINTFLRVHQSYLVNIKLVKEYKNRENSILLESGKEIPVSQRRKAKFREKLMEFVKSAY